MLAPVFTLFQTLFRHENKLERFDLPSTFSLIRNLRLGLKTEAL
jgi:hypothetical protein